MNTNNNTLNNFLSDFQVKTIEELDEVIEKYVLKHTFNNLEVLLHKGHILNLDIDHLIQKVLIENRGGYCFEHNKLFFYGLKESKIQVTSHLARVVYGKKVDVPKTHLLNIILLNNKKYLIDVGFGAYTPSRAIPLDESPTTSKNGNIHRISRSAEGDYELQILKENSFFTLYTFDEKSCTQADIEAANYYSNTHPQSKHVNYLVTTLIRPSGTIFISDAIFSEVIENKRVDKDIKNSEELQKILNHYFGLTVTNQESNKLFEFIQQKENRKIV